MSFVFELNQTVRLDLSEDYDGSEIVDMRIIGISVDSGKVGYLLKNLDNDEMMWMSVREIISNMVE